MMNWQMVVYLALCLVGEGIVGIGIVVYMLGRNKGHGEGYTDGYADGASDGVEWGILTSRNK